MTEPTRHFRARNHKRGLKDGDLRTKDFIEQSFRLLEYRTEISNYDHKKHSLVRIEKESMINKINLPYMKILGSNMFYTVPNLRSSVHEDSLVTYYDRMPEVYYMKVSWVGYG